MSDTPDPTPTEPNTPPEPDESDDRTWQEKRHEQSYSNADQPAESSESE